MGVKTYSFRDLPTQREREAVGTVGTVDTLITAMTACGISECELWSPQIEPQTMMGGGGGGQRGGQSSPEQLKAREDLRTWRVETPIDHFRNVRKRFNTAGISIYAFNYCFKHAFTDQSIHLGFAIARPLV